MGTRNKAPGAASRREKRVFAFYGLAASFFTMALLFVVLERLAGLMVHQFRGWGIVLFSSLCFMAIPATSRETIAASGKFLGVVAARIKKSPLQILTLAILVSGGFLPWELKVSGDFTILPTKKVSVSPEVEGTLKAIHVDEGFRIQRGDVLAEIENLGLSDLYEETRGELRARRSELELLRAGTRPEEIERTKRLVATKSAELQNVVRVDQERQVLLETVAKKQAELQNAQLNYERTSRLLRDGLVARNEADRDRTAYEVRKKELSESQGLLKVLEERTANTRDVKRKELEQAQSELEILRAGSRKETIQGVEAQVQKLEEKLRILSKQLEYLKIRSPIDGVVTTPYLKNRIGEYLEKGSMLCDVVSEGTVIVELPVPEKEIADVHAGFPIIMKVRGYPHSSFEAQVKNIAPIAVEKDQERMVVIQGELENPDGKLKAGMTGVGKILCGKRTVANLMTRRAIRWLRTEFWEYLP